MSKGPSFSCSKSFITGRQQHYNTYQHRNGNQQRQGFRVSLGCPVANCLRGSCSYECDNETFIHLLVTRQRVSLLIESHTLATFSSPFRFTPQLCKTRSSAPQPLKNKILQFYFKDECIGSLF